MNNNKIKEDLSLRGLIEKVQILEQSININHFSMDGINYWPLIRFQMNYHRKYSHWNYTSISGDPATTALSVARNLILEFVDYLKESEKKPLSDPLLNDNISNITPRDVLIVSRLKDHFAKVGGYKFAPLMDGLAMSLAPESFHKMIIGASDDDLEGIFVKGETIDYAPSVKRRFKNPYRSPKTFRKLLKSLKILLNCWKVEKKLRKTNLRLNPEELLYRLDMLQAQKSSLKMFLQSLSPKIIYMTSYTGQSFIVAAARELKIPVVDVQHGGMHQFNVACTHWTNVPKRGYELLPDFFWCWSKEVSNMVNSTIDGYHKAIDGGNPGHHFWSKNNTAIQNLISEDEKRDIEQVKQLPRKKPVVLVALQYGKNALIDPHVLAVFRETRKNYTWLFRMHPMGLDRKGELLKVLGAEGDEDIINWTSRVPLIHLLPHIDCLLTKSSTISREASPFGVKVVFWSQKGGEVHSDLVERGHAGVALNETMLIQTLSNLKMGCQHDTSPSNNSEKIKSVMKYFNEEWTKNRGK